MKCCVSWRCAVASPRRRCSPARRHRRSSSCSPHDFRGEPGHRRRARARPGAARRDAGRAARRAGVEHARRAQRRGAAMPVRADAADASTITMRCSTITATSCKSRYDTLDQIFRRAPTKTQGGRPDRARPVRHARPIRASPRSARNSASARPRHRSAAMRSSRRAASSARSPSSGMRELRNSLIPWGEQRFPRAYRARDRTRARCPICWTDDCWDKKRRSWTTQRNCGRPSADSR